MQKATTAPIVSFPDGQLAVGRPRVPRVDPGVDEAVQRHRERTGSRHRDRDPEQVVRRRDAPHRKERADIGERKREDRVLDLDQAGEERGLPHQV